MQAPENPNLEVPDDYTAPAAKRQRIGDVELPAEYLYPDTEGQFKEAKTAEDGAPVSKGNASGAEGSGKEASAEWEEVFDATYQRNYYYNHATGESSWTDPRAGVKASDGAAEETKVVEVSAPESAESSAKQSAQAGPEPSAATGPSMAEQDAGVLPEPWQEVFDPSYQRNYYYNPQTQTSTWERPVAEASNAEAQAKAES